MNIDDQFVTGVIANVLVMKDFTTRWPIGAWEKGLMSARLSVLIGRLLLNSKYIFNLFSCGLRTRRPVRCPHIWDTGG